MPGLIISFIAFVVSIFYIARAIGRKKIKIFHVTIGLALSLIIFVGILFSFWMSGSVHFITPFLRIQTFQFIIPFVVFYFVRKDNPEEMHTIAIVTTVSIIISGTSILILGDHIAALIEYLGIKTHK